LVAGALLGAVGFEVLKQFGTFLISNTTSNPIYATFAVAVGLLIWINFVTRVTLWAAAWTATDAYAEGVYGEPLDPEDSLEVAEVREGEADRTDAVAVGARARPAPPSSRASAEVDHARP
jgi:membrane protein